MLTQLSGNRRKKTHFCEPYLSYAERMFIRKKTSLYEQGDMGEGFYFIQKGSIKITTIDFKKNVRILDITASRSLIGEQVLDGMPYFSSAITIEDCILYYFSLQKYKELIQNHPEIKLSFAYSIIDKVKTLLNDINEKNIPSENQVACSLLKLMDTFNNVEIHLKQQELSDFIGLTRITLYKILKKWEQEGVLAIKNRKINILKPEIIKQYAIIN